MPDATRPGERRQQAALALSGALQVGTVIFMGTVIAVYVGRRASPFAVSLAASMAALSRVAFAPVWGTIADVTGRRRGVLLVTAALGTLTSLLFVVATDPWAVIALRGLHGVFVAGLFPVLISLVSAGGGDEGRATSIGVFNSTRSVGFTVAQVLAGALLGILASRDLFAVVVAVNLLTALSILFVVDTTPRTDRRPTVGELLEEVRRRLLPAAGERAHLTTNGLHWLYASLTLRHMTWKGMYSLLPIYFITSVGASEIEMGLLLALAPGCEIVGMLVAGRLTDVLGRKPVITYGLAGHVLVALLLAVASVQPPLVGKLVAGGGLVLKAGAFSALFVSSIAFIGDVATRDRESELMGVRSAAMGIGGVLGPLLIGSVATLFGYRLAFVCASLLVLLATALSARKLVESRPGDGPSVVGMLKSGE